MTMDSKPNGETKRPIFWNRFAAGGVDVFETFGIYYHIKPHLAPDRIGMDTVVASTRMGESNCEYVTVDFKTTLWLRTSSK